MKPVTSFRPEPISVDGDLASCSGRWTFAGGVADSFDTHVERSIPNYHLGHELVVEISEFFVSKGSMIYEIGCSTGKLSAAIARRHAGTGARVIGIDNEPDMVALAALEAAQCEGMEVSLGDVRDVALPRCDFIVSYYTIQFIHPKYRQDIFDKIYDSLVWGGAFCLFEKVRAPDARFQDLMTQLYHEFKIANGFTGEEVVAKSRSLKGILEPFSSQANLDYLKRAGFEDVVPIMKHLAFEGVLAIK
jgi:tRNA (cmo5U34)-methyltransferase